MGIRLSPVQPRGRTLKVKESMRRFYFFIFLSKQKHKPVTFTVGLFAGDLADMEGGESHKLSKLNYLLYLTNRAATQSRK